MVTVHGASSRSAYYSCRSLDHIARSTLLAGFLRRRSALARRYESRLYGCVCAFLFTVN